MRTKITLTMALLLSLVSGLQAQSRFVDKAFGVSEPTLDTFSQNLDIFNLLAAGQGIPVNPVRSLEMDVYQPVGDEDLSLRPVVVVWPTGNFLPQYVNQGLYGSRQDSAVVHILRELTARGYVGIAADYRVGWNPRGEQDVRTSTLLQAAYRGGQDAHTMARFLRKTVAEEGNPYRIDTSRIVYWGLGTGGYVAMTHAFLDSVPEILADARFFDENDQPYVIPAVHADPLGLDVSNLPLPTGGSVQANFPQHVEYSSNVAMAINANGALGDYDWIEAGDDEPLVLGFHSPNDIFAPFSYGDVVVPTTNDLVIGCVAGTEEIVEAVNANGTNDAMVEGNSADLPAMFSDLSRSVNALNITYKDQTVGFAPTVPVAPFCIDQPSFTEPLTRSRDNMFPLSSGTGLGAAYNWVDQATAEADLQDFLDEGGELGDDPTLPDAVKIATVLGGEAMVNPNIYNPEGAKVVIDTMIAFFIPRAFIGMELDELVGTNDLISNSEVGLDVFPNPAGVAGFTVRTSAGNPVRSISVMDINGRLAAQYDGVNSTNYTVPRGNLPRGTYILRIQLDNGVTARKLMLD